MTLLRKRYELKRKYKKLLPQPWVKYKTVTVKRLNRVLTITQ